MQKYVCDVCGYIYDPEEGDPDNGVAAGTAFADIPFYLEVPGFEKKGPDAPNVEALKRIRN